MHLDPTFFVVFPVFVLSVVVHECAHGWVALLNGDRTARERGLVTIGFTGSKGEALGAVCDHLLVAPSDDTAIIQQIHLTVAHGICEVIEQALMRDGAQK